MIAWYDFIKSEMPDVFVVQGPPLSYSNPQSNNYPLNFAANPYPGTPIDASNLGNYMLPLGNSVAEPLNPPTGYPPGYGAGNYSNTVGTGIYGASYNAAAGIYKNLGYLPAGYDGVDNNNNGLIDDSAEGVSPPRPTPQTKPRLTWSMATSPTTCTTRRGRRRCTRSSSRGLARWARSSAATTSPRTRSRTPTATACPEFVDAWGQPLQFFRWPILYHTDTQKGQVIDFWDFTQTPPASSANEQLNPPYRTVFELREQDPLDPNQQLVAPSWWSGRLGGNSNSPFVNISGGGWPATTAGTVASGGVVAFEYFFHRLTEPFGHTGASVYYWDRGSIVPYRRAFYSRPLILSGGPDLQPGIFLYPDSPSPPPSASQLLARGE